MWAKQQYSVVMQRTILELRGHTCIPMELTPPSRQSITVSRSFGRPVTELRELKEAIAQRQGELHRNFQGYTTQPESDLLGFGMTSISVLQDVYVQNHKRIQDSVDRKHHKLAGKQISRLGGKSLSTP